MLPVKNSKITCVYGKVNPELWKAKGYHTGIDFISLSNDLNIYSVLEGVVIEARSALGKGADPTGWGNYVIVRVKDKWDLIYAHLSSLNVSKGQYISEGTILGIMGSTGNTSGLHLHFEARKIHWIYKNEINPAVFLDIHNRLGITESLPNKKEDEAVIFKNVIICKEGIDEYSAGFLCDKLNAPVILTKYLVGLTTKQIESIAENIYQIGIPKKLCDKAEVIAIGDRWDTAHKAVDIAKNI